MKDLCKQESPVLFTPLLMLSPPTTVKHGEKQGDCNRVSPSGLSLIGVLFSNLYFSIRNIMSRPRASLQHFENEPSLRCTKP